jgi:hypothetical protein
MYIYCTDTYIRVGQPTNATNAATINATADEGVATRTVPSGHCSLPHRFLFHPRQAGHKKHAKLGPALFFNTFPPISTHYIVCISPTPSRAQKTRQAWPCTFVFNTFPPISTHYIVCTNLLD